MIPIATRINHPQRLTLKLQVDFDYEKGTPTLKSYSFSNIRAAATDDDLLLVATALASLSSYPPQEIIRNTSYGMIPE